MPNPLTALRSALGDAVLAPDDPRYPAFRTGLFTPLAAAARPACVVQPEDATQVATAVRIARDSGCAVTTRGGGLSTICSATDAVVIDMKARMGGGRLIGDKARMGGGATMGQALAVLAPAGRVVPIGSVPIAGMGLATQGGFGHLTRSHGLTLDHLVEVELVTADGEIRTLSDASTGSEAELWWAVRGATPPFGVVTAATFRSHMAPVGLTVIRSVSTVEAFTEFTAWANDLPEDVCASCTLVTPTGATGPVLFAYVVAPTAAADRVRNALDAACGAPTWQESVALNYSAQPAFDPPGTGEPIAGPIWCAEKCPLLGRVSPEVAVRIVGLMRSAPSHLCRIDFQHAGGVMSRIATEATAFAGRRALWNVPIIGAWAGSGDSPVAPACGRWVSDVWVALDACIVGAYSTEIRPGLPETSREVALAFGPNLPRLGAIKRLWDPTNVFRHSYPLEVVAK
ncbi:MAG: FAD-binding oxidoreductase [Planctomycetes bacterium]|nr:FAD-binding oxidoreductase [Planctomycetota bacterium]